MAQRGKRHADQKLLLALACGASVEMAAQSAGVSLSTAYRRLAEPDFQRQLQQLRADMVQRTAGTLTAAGGEAVKTLLALQKEAMPPATRLGAARAILELGVKIRETAELQERIAALEAAEQARARAAECGRRP
jgi:hypothetical protein